MSRTRAVVTGVAALAAVAAIGACSNSATEQSPSASASSAAPAQSSAAAPAAAHNQADMMFAHMMIPHHQQAVEMSDMILAKQGIDPRVIDLANQIKAAQGPEVTKMQGWLQQWGMQMSGTPGMPGMGGTSGAPPPDHGGMHGSDTATASPGMGGMPGMDDMPGMQGMMSPADMQALRSAQGVEASRLFLTQMIEHHRGAVTMAQNEIKNGQSPDAIALAKSIETSQQKEIDTMNQILSSL